MRKILMIMICTMLCSCSADFLDISASEEQSLSDTNNTTINHIESLNETDLLSKLPVPDPIQYTISLFWLPYSTTDTTETDYAVEIGYAD